MRSVGAVVLVVAVALGGFSVLVARQVLGEARTPAPGEPVATVVVAAAPMGFGQRLTEKNLKEIKWPAANLPDGAFRSVTELTRGGQSHVVLRAIEANEPILASKISGPGGRATLSAVIGEGMRAVTIRVNDVNGVAGFVLPGDRVDVMLTRDHNRSSPVTDYLLQNVKVLGIDQEADNKEKPKVARAVTLEVTPEQAQKLTLGAQVGSLGLALRNVSNTRQADARTVTLADLGVREANIDQPGAETLQVSDNSVVRLNRGGQVDRLVVR